MLRSQGVWQYRKEHNPTLHGSCVLMRSSRAQAVYLEQLAKVVLFKCWVSWRCVFSSMIFLHNTFSFVIHPPCVILSTVSIIKHIQSTLKLSDLPSERQCYLSNSLVDLFTAYAIGPSCSTTTSSSPNGQHLHPAKHLNQTPECHLGLSFPHVQAMTQSHHFYLQFLLV